MKYGSDSRLNLGLLVLRFGVAVSFVLLIALRQSNGPEALSNEVAEKPLLALSCGFVLVVCGFLTRPAAAFVALSWAWVAYASLRAGTAWTDLPVRAVEFSFLFATLAVMGAGKISIDHWLRLKTAGKDE
jgi:hypothetical protein